MFSVSPLFSAVKKETKQEKKARLDENLRIRKEAETARTELEATEAIRKAEQASVTPDKSIEATNEYIANSWDTFNRSVDTFFTNTNSPTENRSSVFLSTSGIKREGQKFDTEIDFKWASFLLNREKC